MSVNNPGIQPGGAGATTPTPGGQQPQAPQGKVDQSDADAFNAAVKSNGQEQDTKADETVLTPEQELAKMMRENSMKQFINNSQEKMKEIKKNMEG